MEQALLDSSKYRIHSLSLDSRFASQYNKGTADFVIRVPTTYKNIQRIALSSAEIPLVEYLFSASHGNINLSVTIGAITTNLTITEGNYIDVQLVDELERVLQTVDSAFTCERSSITGKVTITNTSPFSLSLVSSDLGVAERPTQWGLGYFLGFRTKTVLSSSAGPAPYTLTGDTIILIQPSPYYLLQLGVPDQVYTITHCTAGATAVEAFAKVILDDDFYNVQFNDKGDRMRKEYTFLAPTNVSQIRARLVDPYGCTVDMRSTDWSFTIELYEVVNSRTYTHMTMTYER